VFAETGCTAALAATLLHYGIIKIPELKDFLLRNNIEVRYSPLARTETWMRERQRIVNKNKNN
jgi:hypothetical protein